MAKVKNEHYITIQEFMVNDLELSGNELIAYALIYGFSQDGESYFKGSLSYVAKWLNCSKATACTILNKLADDGFLEKKEKNVNGVRLCDYTAYPIDENTLSEIKEKKKERKEKEKAERYAKKLNTTSKNRKGYSKNLNGSSKNLNGGIQKTLTHNTTDILDDIKDENIDDTIANSFSNEKDNSKETLELHNSHFPKEQKNESHISVSLGVKQKQPKEKPLKDMPTRAKEMADNLVDDTELSEGVQECIAYFLEKYKRKNRKEHLPLRNETLQSVVEVMLSSLTVPHDENLENRYQCVFYPLVSEASEWEDRKEVIDKYFDTDFREKCDYSLVHFTQRDIITHVMQKCYIGEDVYWFYSESVD